MGVYMSTHGPGYRSVRRWRIIYVGPEGLPEDVMPAEEQSESCDLADLDFDSGEPGLVVHNACRRRSSLSTVYPLMSLTAQKGALVSTIDDLLRSPRREVVWGLSSDHEAEGYLYRRRNISR